MKLDTILLYGGAALAAIVLYNMLFGGSSTPAGTTTSGIGFTSQPAGPVGLVTVTPSKLGGF